MSIPSSIDGLSDYCQKQWAWMRDQHGYGRLHRLLVMPFFAAKFVIRTRGRCKMVAAISPKQP